MSAALAALLALVALAARCGATRSPPRGSAAGREEWADTRVPRMASAEAQLGHARRLKRRMAAAGGDADVRARRELAVRAYRAVRVFHPGARAAAAEAAFRAGELLRAGGDEAGALDEFRWAAEHGGGTDFAPRARLEVAHAHRRAGRWQEALSVYVGVAADEQVDAGRREDAWLWAGSAWLALGRVADARDAWERVARDGVDPLARVRAFDELALLRVADGDLEGAAGELDRCLRALSARALEETETGARVRGALSRMRVVGELRSAIERRNDSSRAREPPRKP